MPTRCTEAATCSGIRKSGTTAGKPGKPDRTSGPPPALLIPSRSSKSPRPECASEPPWGLAAAIGLQFRFGVQIGILRAIEKRVFDAVAWRMKARILGAGSVIIGAPGECLHACTFPRGGELVIENSANQVDGNSLSVALSKRFFSPRFSSGK